MIIESAEKLELEIVEGAKKLVRVYIDESTDNEGSIKYRYKQLVFSINDSIEVIANRVKKVKDNLYVELREAEYPPMAEYLDAVVKGDTVAINEYISKCLEIKVKYPKESKC